MHTLEKVLEKIDFKTENGLVLCNTPHKDSYIGELYHIEEKAKKLRATAVLFRRKYEKEKITDSKPLVYIFHEKDDFSINSDKHKDLHAKIWSASEIDVYFIVSKTEIQIFNSRKPAEVENKDQEKLSLKNLVLATQALEKFDDQRFSAIVFAKGTFWDQEDFFDHKKESFFKNQLEEKYTPFHQLLEHLIDVRKHLHDKRKELSEKIIDKLLIICILVKFLEEIKDNDGEHTLKDIYNKYEVEDFAQALEKGVCISVLKELAEQFNGKIFDQFSNQEKQQIEQSNLELIADFLKAKLDISQEQKQYFLWKQYSFNHLPVELISSIYENFLPKEKGVVYTPPFLVNFLIDEVMALDKAEEYFSENKFKVLDPACGSGVFLVAAYKRMLQWWSVNHYKKKEQIKFPDKQVCQEILENNIFGVDIHPTATMITIFSLTIALLDKLEPKEIWDNLRLKDLSKNIQSQSFFDWIPINKDREREFDLVIGNPPFNRLSKITKKGVDSENNIEQLSINKKDIPRNNFALKFFECAMFFGKKTCLILPSNVLLYNKTKSAQKYRNRIFTKFTIEKIFDFTHLREVLFVKKSPKHSDNKNKTGRTPVCAVLSICFESQGQNIEHTVIKRISSIEKKIIFEIDHYDRHFVPHDWSIDETKQFVWKTNLLGGGRLFHLIYRLSLLPKLKDFIDSKSNWKEIRGFEGGTKLVAENQDRIIEIMEGGEPEIQRNVDIRSDNLKDLFMYEPPFMIFDQVLGKNSLPVCFIPKNSNFTQKERLYYNRDFIGISAPQEDENTLKDIFNFIRLKKTNNQLNYQLYVLSISSSSLVLTETDVNKSEILSVPYCPENQEYLELSDTEKILQDDVLEYYIHLGKAITERGQGRKLHEKVSEYQLKKFGEVFCDTLNPIYAKNGKSWQSGKFYQTQSFTICQFGYGKNKGLSFELLDDLDDIIKPLIYNNKSNRGVVFTRVCRIYKHVSGYDCLFLIKPNAIRYWLNSIALRDADETFIDLKKAGL